MGGLQWKLGTNQWSIITHLRASALQTALNDVRQQLIAGHFDNMPTTSKSNYLITILFPIQYMLEINYSNILSFRKDKTSKLRIMLFLLGYVMYLVSTVQNWVVIYFSFCQVFGICFTFQLIFFCWKANRSDHFILKNIYAIKYLFANKKKKNTPWKWFLSSLRIKT